MKVYLLCTILILSVSKLYALIGFEDALFPELAVTGRAQAMGNAFVAKSDDYASAFYNPAGLGSVRKPHLHLSNIHLEGNKTWIQATTAGSATDAVGNLTKGFSLDGMREILLEKKGTTAHSRFSLAPNFTSRYFSAGWLLSYINRGRIKNEDNALYEYAQRRDTGPFAAINLSLFGGIFKFGVMGAMLYRREVISESNVNVPVDLQSGDYYNGSMVLVNVGLKLTLPYAGLPTLAAHMHNALNNEFSEKYLGAPTKVPNQVDVGFSLTPQIGRSSRIHFEIDYKDITGVHSDISSTRKINLGAEIDFVRRMFIRFGYGDGYGSFGLGIKSKKLKFDFTTYARDISDSGFRGVEDRRFSLTLSSGI